jgi:hypothetical protein
MNDSRTVAKVAGGVVVRFCETHVPLVPPVPVTSSMWPGQPARGDSKTAATAAAKNLELRSFMLWASTVSLRNGIQLAARSRRVRPTADAWVGATVDSTAIRNRL